MWRPCNAPGVLWADLRLPFTYARLAGSGEAESWMKRLIPGLLLAGMLAMTGCVAAPVQPYPPVPPPIAEIVPKPPVSERPMIWQPGHWDWSGNGYSWRQGEWVPREGHGSLWQDGSWTFGNGGWFWVPGHWV